MSFSSDPSLLEPSKQEEHKISNESTTAEITGLCPSYQYDVCLQLANEDESLKTKPFCQVII